MARAQQLLEEGEGEGKTEDPGRSCVLFIHCIECTVNLSVKVAREHLDCEIQNGSQITYLATSDIDL